MTAMWIGAVGIILVGIYRTSIGFCKWLDGQIAALSLALEKEQQ